MAGDYIDRHMERKHELYENELTRRIRFLENQLACEIERRSHVEKLLSECLTHRYYDEYKVSPGWLRDALAAFPKIEGERR